MPLMKRVTASVAFLFMAVGMAIANAGPASAVPTTTVGGITVNVDLAPQLRRLLSAASAAGLRLGGGGYRSPAKQIALRKLNCGTSHYDVWRKPSSQCSLPTAIPGRSMHEQGLAVDFTSAGRLIRSHNDRAWIWLHVHARRYGLYNLASESWHWSTNGH